MKKVLIITYYWPPAGGPGVQRPLKFVKYLREFGWEPVVLTAKNGDYSALDESLVNQVNSTTKIYKTSFPEPHKIYKLFKGLKKNDRITSTVLTDNDNSFLNRVSKWVRLNLFLPDARVLWLFFGQKKIRNIFQKNEIDIIFSSGPPHTTHLLARKYSKKFNVPYIIDFRDPWIEFVSYQTNKRSFLSLKIDQYLEQKVIYNASEFIVVTDKTKTRLYNTFIKPSVTVITNGYDEEDFIGNELTYSNFVITYTGNLDVNRIPYFFIKSVAKFEKEKPNSIQLKLIGRICEEMKVLIEKSGLKHLTEFTPYVKHTEVINQLKQSFALLLVVDDVKNNDCYIPGKLFEYMGSQRRIIAIGPKNSDVERILNETNAGTYFDYIEENEMYKHLNELYTHYNKKTVFNNSSLKYTRKNLTQDLSKILIEQSVNKLQKTSFMIRRLTKDFMRPTTVKILNQESIHSKKLGHYYHLFEEDKMQNQKGGKDSFKFDNAGIPLVPSYIDVDSNDFTYYPITIGQYALAVFHSFLNTRSKKDLKRFLVLADWFMENKSYEKELGYYWLTHTEKPEYRVKGPWKSAFSQSRAISILLRAYQETGKKEYLETAIKSINIYNVLNKDGGVKAIYSSNVIYEEYTANFNIGVLDGAFFSMYGLFDLKRSQPDLPNLDNLISNGVKGLLNLLPEYDMGFWLKYSKTEAEFYPSFDPATKAYFYLVLSQLKVFYYYTGEEQFDRYYQHFLKYDTFKNVIKMYIQKYKALKQLKRL